MRAVTLVRASEKNAWELADISKRAFHTDIHVGSPWGESGPPGYDSPEAQARFMNGCDYYEIRYRDALVGAIMVLKKNTAHYECCGLFVDPAYHNRGIATRAFELIWTVYPDAKRWTVGTPAWNERTNHFYQKLGFVKAGTDGPDGIVYERRMSQSRRGKPNMRKTCSSLMLAVILVTACKASPLPAGAEPFSEVRAHIERLVADGEIPSMAVAVARDGEIIWEEGFGLVDRERDIPATEHTPYPLASISKPLTATGLMILVERGLVNLDRPINDYLNEARLQARVGDAAGATVRRVASHTAGLPLHSQHFYDDEPYRPPPMDETIHRYGNLVTAPGERYQYSNLGYGFLDYLISRVSGKSYADFMREEVFVPLGMDHTSVHVGPGLEEGQAVKYTPEGAMVPPYDSDSPGASAIYGSAHDLVRFAMYHLKDSLPDQRAIISESAIDEMQRPSPETGPTMEWEREGSGYGIGWFIGVGEDGLRVVHHNGGTVGVSTVLALVPEEDLAVAVLSNTHSQWPDAILIEIVCVLLSLQPEEFLPPNSGAADEPPFAPIPGLVGSWRGLVHTCEGGIPLVLEIGESGSVHATLGKQPRTLLQSVSYQDNFPQFLNAGGGPFLRGWMQGELDTADVGRGRPYRLWLELKLRDDVLNGSLIAFSQREFHTGPLAHWVALKKRPLPPGSFAVY